MKQMKIISGLFSFSLVLASFAHASTESVTPIVGGQTVADSSVIARRTVSLFMVENTGEQGFCTGSIIDNSHILTAAHCVQNFKAGIVIFARSGIVDIVKAAASKGVASSPLARLMTSAVAKPGYSPTHGGTGEFNDLAIITFNGGLAPGYEPAKFLSKTDLMNSLSKNAPVTLAGYGITVPPPARTTKEAPAAKPAAGSDDGLGTLRNVNLGMLGVSAKGIDLYIGGNDGHNACSGDSGGPAMVQKNNETYVIGVDSRGDCRTLSIYTLVYQQNITL